MPRAYLPLVVFLLLIAIFMRDDFALTLVYFIVGAYAAGAWWSNRALSQVKHVRHFSSHAFLGEKVQVKLRLRNQGWLPVAWLSIRDSLPVALVNPSVFERVLSLGPRSEADFVYSLEARKRGFYEIGPLQMSSGDILGLGRPLQADAPGATLTVYPRIVPLARLTIPSRSPHGTLRHTQPIFEDPTRIFGKREYIPGDSLRRVDWKSTAASGQMQVKLFEPSIALETQLFLNLNAEDYHYRTRIDATELAVVIAASVANWIAGKQQTVGLQVNGRDPLAADGIPQSVPARKGKAHLMRILETLARVEMSNAAGFTALIQRARYSLPWGTTLIVITGQADDALLDELYQARRAGQSVVLILSGTGADAAETRRKAGYFGIPVWVVASERDLEQMR